MKKHKAYRVKVIVRNSCLIALLLVMAIIFIMSNQSAKDSYKVTGTVVSVISKEPISQSDWDARSVVVTVMRKLAHITLFSLLGFFASNYFICTEKYASIKKAFVITFVLCILYAISDEFHQMFIPGRGASPMDILWDLIGSIIGILVSFLIIWAAKKCKDRYAQKRKCGSIGEA